MFRALAGMFMFGAWTAAGFGLSAAMAFKSSDSAVAVSALG
jgi:hypothetical protein